jgi:hypothetical protein
LDCVNALPEEFRGEALKQWHEWEAAQADKARREHLQAEKKKAEAAVKRAEAEAAVKRAEAEAAVKRAEAEAAVKRADEKKADEKRTAKKADEKKADEKRTAKKTYDEKAVKKEYEEKAVKKEYEEKVVKKDKNASSGRGSGGNTISDVVRKHFITSDFNPLEDNELANEFCRVYQDIYMRGFSRGVLHERTSSASRSRSPHPPPPPPPAPRCVPPRQGHDDKGRSYSR